MRRLAYTGRSERYVQKVLIFYFVLLLLSFIHDRLAGPRVFRSSPDVDFHFVLGLQITMTSCGLGDLISHSHATKARTSCTTLFPQPRQKLALEADLGRHMLRYVEILWKKNSIRQKACHVSLDKVPAVKA